VSQRVPDSAGLRVSGHAGFPVRCGVRFSAFQASKAGWFGVARAGLWDARRKDSRRLFDSLCPPFGVPGARRPPRLPTYPARPDPQPDPAGPGPEGTPVPRHPVAPVPRDPGALAPQCLGRALTGIWILETRFRGVRRQLGPAPFAANANGACTVKGPATPFLLLHFTLRPQRCYFPKHPPSRRIGECYVLSPLWRRVAAGSQIL
jgi:hypothetical protein